jgi:endonuclease/exonuclease/phosphatase family metal-dependent hydrolase
MELPIFTYNIHKGFRLGNTAFVLEEMRNLIQEVHADIVFLQEVIGHNKLHSETVLEWPEGSQFEYLADSVWDHYTYGKNAVHSDGHHGNAILSKYPILEWNNTDISTNNLEQRGMLYAKIAPPQIKVPLHLFCVHLNLTESGRKKQITQIQNKILNTVPIDEPIILAGDFNDWWQSASQPLQEGLGLKEAYKSSQGRHAKTFPSFFPVMKLDRIYYRGFEVKDASVLKDPRLKNLSDHLPLITTLTTT